MSADYDGTEPIGDRELDHQRDVLRAMIDSGIPMDDGGIALALSVIARLDAAETELTSMRAEHARYWLALERIGGMGTYETCAWVGVAQAALECRKGTP
jgi:hypothetical protein